jgi:hypothetical protein
MYRHKENVEHDMYGDTGNNWNSNKSLKKSWKPYQENIQETHYKRQLYLEHHNNTESTAV